MGVGVDKFLRRVLGDQNFLVGWFLNFSGELRNTHVPVILPQPSPTARLLSASCLKYSGSLLHSFPMLAWVLSSFSQVSPLIMWPLLSVSSPTVEMLPGNSSQGLSRSCISATSIVMPPSVCMKEAETALRTKGRERLLVRKISHWCHCRIRPWQLLGARNPLLSKDLRVPFSTSPGHTPAQVDRSLRSLLLLVPRAETLRSSSFPNPLFECLCPTAGSGTWHSATCGSRVKRMVKNAWEALGKGLACS